MILFPDRLELHALVTARLCLIMLEDMPRVWDELSSKGP